MDWSATVVNDRTESHRRSLIIRDHNQSARRVAIGFVSSDRLRQQSAPFADERTLEITDFEDRSTRLRGRTLQFGTVDLDETLALQKFAEETPDPSLQLEHCLVRLCLLNTVNKRSQNVDVLTYPKVDNAVV